MHRHASTRRMHAAAAQTVGWVTISFVFFSEREKDMYLLYLTGRWIVLLGSRPSGRRTPTNISKYGVL